MSQRIAITLTAGLAGAALLQAVTYDSANQAPGTAAPTKQLPIEVRIEAIEARSKINELELKRLVKLINATIVAPTETATATP